MLAGEPAAIPALEAVSEHTDAMVQCWGQTEAPASTTLLSRGEMRQRELWSSIGRPIPGVEFSVLSDGQVMDRPEPGVDGELVIRTPSVATALIGGEDEHAERLLPDGWWRTSDLGHFDDEGRVYIVGRASETIITGGTNIQPVEIERALEAHAVCVKRSSWASPTPEWGETPAAYVHVTELGDSTAAQLENGSGRGSPASSGRATCSCRVTPSRVPRESPRSPAETSRSSFARGSRSPPARRTT